MTYNKIMALSVTLYMLIVSAVVINGCTKTQIVPQLISEKQPQEGEDSVRNHLEITKYPKGSDFVLKSDYRTNSDADTILSNIIHANDVMVNGVPKDLDIYPYSKYKDGENGRQLAFMYINTKKNFPDDSLPSIEDWLIDITSEWYEPDKIKYDTKYAAFKLVWWAK